MDQNLQLPEPIYNALQQAAAANGMTAAGWIAAHLPPCAAESPFNGANSLADAFKNRTGRVHSTGKEVLSENCAENFARDLEQRRNEGKL
jgi:hypothetical protein